MNCMLFKKIIYSVSLNAIKHNFNRDRNIIIHHGLMGSAKNFRSVSKNKAFSQYVNVHLIDARNHGQSPHTDTHTIEDLADDLFEYIRSEKLDEKGGLTLMGHSMGAIALMQFTKKYSSPQIQKYIDRVILIDISSRAIISNSAYRQTGEMLRQMNEINLNQPIKKIHEEIQKFALSPDIAGLIKSSVVHIQGDKHKWKVNLPVLVKYYPNIGGYSLLDKNQSSLRWQKPVDMIYGGRSGYVDQDHIYDFKKAYPQMSDDHFYRVQKAGHWVHFDETKEFLRIVDFLLKKDKKK